MGKWYRYLEIMNFGDGDKRTSTMSSLHELPKEDLGHIHQDYRITLKLTEEEYEEIHKLLEYKGEYSYNELKAKVAVLTERLDKAIEYIKEHIRIDDEYPSYMEMLLEERNELLEILGDKE